MTQRFKFEEGRLWIATSGGNLYRIRAWPYPRAETARKGGRWKFFYPEFRLIHDPMRKRRKVVRKNKTGAEQLELGLNVPVVPPTQPAMTKAEGFELLRKTVHEPFARVIAPFQTHQWNPLVFLSLCPDYYDLLQSSPALAYYLANHKAVCFRALKEHKTYLPKLVGMKQTDLLYLVELPRMKRLVKIVKRIRPEAVHIDNIFELQKALKYPAALKMLSHLKTINAGVLAVAGQPIRYQPYVTPHFMHELSRDPRNNVSPNVTYDIDACLEMHQKVYPRQRFPKILSLAWLQQYYDGLVEEKAVQDKLEEERPFPPPPIAGTLDIVPITTAEDLREEGLRQHNCVFTYASRVRNGTHYVYRVLKPEIATLSIMRHHNAWRIDDLKLACNIMISDKTKEAIDLWLEKNQMIYGL